MQLSGGQALIRALEMEGVEVMFGLPGGAILPVYDPIIDSPIRHILVRHEQGAGHMAEGYAHATGRPGVCMVTSGPAATNVVTPLCDAFMDSVPVVCITGQVPFAAIGTDAFQECDTIGITRSVTKHNELITEAQDIPLAVRQAFHLATTGRPGPVLLVQKSNVDHRLSSRVNDWHAACIERRVDRDSIACHPLRSPDCPNAPTRGCGPLTPRTWSSTVAIRPFAAAAS